jgi:hypothetical protein
VAACWRLFEEKNSLDSRLKEGAERSATYILGKSARKLAYFI